MTLATLVTEYLAYKRALGHRFVSEGHILRSFCRHIGDGPLTAVSVDRVLAFIQGAHTSPATAARKHRVLAGLAQHAWVRHRGATLSVPPAPRKRPSSFVPYIYSQEELKRLLDAAPATCTARTFIQAYVLRTLLLMLYGAGLRLSEALALSVADVNLEQAVLTIRQTKFYNSRFERAFSCWSSGRVRERAHSVSHPLPLRAPRQSWSIATVNRARPSDTQRPRSGAAAASNCKTRSMVGACARSNARPARRMRDRASARRRRGARRREGRRG